MSRPPTLSNIRVSVAFETPVVFAGEDVACTITFKNIAQTTPRTSPSPSYINRHGARKLSQGRPHPLTSRQSSHGPSSVPAHLRGGAGVHRAVSSMGGRLDGMSLDGNPANGRPKHGRSLSIMSMGTDVGTVMSMPRGHHDKGKGHERTVSVQTAPRRMSGGREVSGQGPGKNSPRVAAPLITEQDMDMANGQATIRPKRRPISEAKKSPGIMNHEFKFPAADAPSSTDPESAISPKTDSLPFHHHRALSPPLSDSSSSANPIARVLSQASTTDGSPRSSLDLFSEALSTHSDETNFSEMPITSSVQQGTRLLPQRPAHVRTNSRLGVREATRGPEQIIMGYAQIHGSFTLEGSLVNQAPFEEIKRRGVVGSHGGGGVVGVERTGKRDSGLFGAFGWGNIGESLNSLVGGGEMSSIREMNKTANSKSIPLVTTPPSILFVDLKLAPGESRAYSYRFTMPRGLPPSHKGRSIKVAYHLVIGTQRPGQGKGKDLQVKSVEIPFRVFGSVDGTGDILGHDLMSPYILLRDQAKTSPLEPGEVRRSPAVEKKKPPDSAKEGEAEFKNYIAALLEHRPSNGANGTALLSPTSPLASPSLERNRRRESSVGAEPTTQIDLINLAILRSNNAALAKTGGLSNKLNIARSGQHVATLHLTRPAFRLGETVHLIASFKDAVIPTYALQICLETRETVDPAIAMRSPSSIYRYTRKVLAYDAGNTLFANRLSFSLTIPANGTPEFVTSGISLEWRVRVEFVVPRHDLDDDEEVLEEVVEDERGVALQGIERLHVETFEVAVPVRVYGAVGAGSGERSSDVEDVPV